jgi:hypothetical protein
MQEWDLALVLDSCLEQVEQGAEPRAVAAQYPDLKDRLLPLLELARVMREEHPDPPFRAEFFRRLGDDLRAAG